ncbi:MAG: hypothetical protein HGA31_04000 [Candidatus Moranbacteria bacterium]|nr:hypothetical protein [Candidatus Moranbacteria bacterium]
MTPHEILRFIFGIDTSGSISRGAIWTFFLAIVAYLQFRKANHISSADFIHRLKNDFFGKETRELFFLFEKDYLRYEEESETFEVVRIDEKTKSELGITRKFFTIYEVDDFLLGDIYDLGLFEQKKIVDIDMVYEEFGYYVATIWENKAVRYYIENQRKDPRHRDVYNKLDYIGLKCELYAAAKLNGTPLLLLQVRSIFSKTGLRKLVQRHPKTFAKTV